MCWDWFPPELPIDCCQYHHSGRDDNYVLLRRRTARHEQAVTAIIERGVSLLTTSITSIVKREGISQVRINFTWMRIPTWPVDVIQRVNRILTLLLTGVSQPIALRFDITNLPVCNSRCLWRHR